MLHSDTPVWRWYLEREAAVLPSLPAGLAPRLLLAAPEAGVIVVERIFGEPLARRRRLEGLPGCDLESLLDAVAAWQGAAELPSAAPPPPVRAAMRRRLLEDPSAPLEWFRAGFERCRDLGIAAAPEARRMTAALAAYPETGPCHGDLLPRNVVAGGGSLRAVDWECAGLHARDWDRALLWTSVPAARPALEAAPRTDAAAPGRWPAFLALAAFALAREIKFARRSTAQRRAALAGELAATLARLVEDG